MINSNDQYHNQNNKIQNEFKIMIQKQISDIINKIIKEIIPICGVISLCYVCYAINSLFFTGY